MSEIKVGDYIRTDYGTIGKLLRKEYDKNADLHWYVFKARDEFGIEKESYINKAYITKHSKNIIDLIEVGDIVHTKDVLNEDYYYMYDEEMVQATKETIEQGVTLVDILTKEQYNQNSFKLEE